MGEPILHVSSSSPNLEDKTGEAAPSNPALEVSVSFGAFENDSLSWEKWSSFSPNKYLEEVKKCSTPGSVAEKAAYFEAHYKKIAARKAGLLDQEKQMDNDSSRMSDETCGDLIGVNCENNSVSDVSGCRRSDAVVYQETYLANEQRGALVDGPVGDAAITVEFQGSSVEGVKPEESRTPTLDTSEEPLDDTVKEEAGNTSMGMENVTEMQEKEIEPTTYVKKDKARVNKSKGSQKVSRERSVSSIKKKPRSSVAKASPITNASSITNASPITKASAITLASPITKASPLAKAPQLSTPRVSKPAPMSTPLSSSRSSTKIGNVLSSSMKKVLAAGERKKVAPKALHMSLSLDPSSSHPASLSTTRKSLIMEKMGDKDIVRRVFMTFQNNCSELKSANEELLPAPEQEIAQVPAKWSEPRVSTLMTPRKENAVSFKQAGMEKKSAKAPSSLTLKRDEKAEKRRDHSKKLEEKSSTREAERRLQAKSKDL